MNTLIPSYDPQHESDIIGLEGGGDREAKPPSSLQIKNLKYFAGQTIDHRH